LKSEEIAAFFRSEVPVLVITRESVSDNEVATLEWKNFTHNRVRVISATFRSIHDMGDALDVGIQHENFPDELKTADGSGRLYERWPVVLVLKGVVFALVDLAAILTKHLLYSKQAMLLVEEDTRTAPSMLLNAFTKIMTRHNVYSVAGGFHVSVFRQGSGIDTDIVNPQSKRDARHSGWHSGRFGLLPLTHEYTSTATLVAELLHKNRTNVRKEGYKPHPTPQSAWGRMGRYGSATVFSR